MYIHATSSSNMPGTEPVLITVWRWAGLTHIGVPLKVCPSLALCHTDPPPPCPFSLHVEVGANSLVGHFKQLLRSHSPPPTPSLSHPTLPLPHLFRCTTFTLPIGKSLLGGSGSSLLWMEMWVVCVCVCMCVCVCVCMCVCVCVKPHSIPITLCCTLSCHVPGPPTCVVAPISGSGNSSTFR